MYTVDAFFWYKAVFMVELLVAESLTAFRLKRRKWFGFRALGAVTVCIGTAFAMPVVDDGALFASFMYLVFFVVTLFAMWFCFDAKFRSVTFCGLAGYAAQHIAYEIFDISTVLMGIHNVSDTVTVGSNPFASFVPLVYGSGNSVLANVFVMTVYLSELFIVYWAVFRIVSARMRGAGDTEIAGGTMLGIFALTMVFDIVIGAVITEHGAEHFDAVYVLVTDIANIFCCGLALYMQFGVARMRKLDSELESINRIWEQSKIQYALTKQNIDMINFKCHDLKHQIRKMGTKNELNPEVLGEMENIISVYDAGVKTGNAALDVILTEKSLYCNHRGIVLSCIADGKQLDFMSEQDLYSVFGNILDNAVEAVEHLAPENRVIGISVKRIKDFVFVNVYNFFDGAVRFVNGLPATTKGDEKNHGFGMKSVRMIAEKYGGELKVTAENGIFNTDLVFPRSAPAN